ncbi:LLM class flavin-dependent oxidoreductase [uncultured Friedmanniella sp.]|uniref:LLM class flavin-dependent oxidoreductase n=1 Tax=uncultured Friedmanniella sp. TaxID=335381 RepID=UPI0035CAF979
MSAPERPLRKLGFLTIGVFDEHAPGAGHENTLQVIELGEQLGFDSVWLRHRHLQFGISSPVAVLAAASQRTTRITFGTAVTPLGAENPFRLAEDLATVDVLSGGRLNPGFSVGTPMGYERYREALYPDTWENEDLSATRLLRLLAHLRGEPVTSGPSQEGFEAFSDHVQPHAPGLADRVWYGGAGLASVEWAGDHGLNLLTSSVIRAEEGGADGEGWDFARIQAEHIRRFRARHPLGADARVSQGLVVIPTDTATPEQARRYAAYAEARLPRTRQPLGPGRMLFAPDLVGTSAEIAEALHGHAAFREVEEVAFALPFTFEHEDYVQILTDIATRLGPQLGWRPSTEDGDAEGER